MSTIIEGVRQVLGIPDGIELYPEMLKYVGLFEYIISGLLLIVVVASVFKILVNWSK